MRRNGFTLIELLVVISIIAILGGIIFGAVGSCKQNAADLGTSSSGNMVLQVADKMTIVNDGTTCYVVQDPQGRMFLLTTNPLWYYGGLGLYGKLRVGHTYTVHVNKSSAYINLTWIPIIDEIVAEQVPQSVPGPAEAPPTPLGEQW